MVFTEDELQALLDAVRYQADIAFVNDRPQYLEVWAPLKNKLLRALAEITAKTR
jgi:hypothetical protein